MAVYILKSIHWNAQGYIRPGGHKATSGYPKERGFGHEEWNASPRMRFEREGVWHRAFHTESVRGDDGKAPGDTTVFLFASHHGRQELVGIAGQARHIADAAYASERRKIRDDLGIESFWKEAWTVDLVRKRFAQSEERFRAEWRKHLGHWPTWTCPEDHFVWLKRPVEIDASRLTNGERLMNRFTGHTGLDVDQAMQLIDLVSEPDRNVAWHNLRAGLDASEDAKASDIKELEGRRGLAHTTRKALIDARLGQGQFRKDLEKKFGVRCAVTGCAVGDVLRASHVVEWSKCDDDARLDPNNGLLLAAHLDALFDRHLVSFEQNGAMLISSSVSTEDRKLLGLPQALSRALQRNEEKYMRHHRTAFHDREGASC